ncbi:hypothetical protein BMS3Abin16_00908 [archaeon BMS3Abin16]|nr:hypothetical protein BMS3Abin16_00908 [archaeon BMS3Abin16]
MGSLKSGAIVVLLILLVSAAGCLNTPNIDKEKAGYIAGIHFLETHPGEVASYSVSDPGGDAYVVYFNRTAPGGAAHDFAEYYVDKYNRNVYVSSKYATVLAVTQNKDLEKLFKRYPSAQIEGELLDPSEAGGKKYVWKIRVIANGVHAAIFGFDAVEEKIVGTPTIYSSQTINIQPV